MRLGTLNALGMYPGDPCYDSSRPSWLPYWIDDLTESKCKYSSDSILGATANAAGQAVGWTANTVGSAVGTAAGGVVQGVTQQLSIPGYLLVAGAVILGVVLLKNR